VLCAFGAAVIWPVPQIISAQPGPHLVCVFCSLGQLVEAGGVLEVAGGLGGFDATAVVRGAIGVVAAGPGGHS
jgi:hypothetical protein